MTNITKRIIVPAAEEILDLYFPVLDHGFVALKDYMGGDHSVMRAARVSYGAGTKGVNTDRDMLRYMARAHHTSPFEQCEMVFHCKLPIFVARQLIRHRTASVNEYSMRYSLPEMEFYVPEPENLGGQSKRNKQGRADPIPTDDANFAIMRWRQLQEESVELYEIMTAKDCDLARELARLHLPLSIYTQWYWKIDLHNALHFLNLRCDGHAQWEIQQFANVKAAIINRVAPIAFEAWIDYVFQARTFSRMEMQILQEIVGINRYHGPGDEFIMYPIACDTVVDGDKIREKHGLSKREWSEFLDSFQADYDPKRFELDLSTAKTGEYFAQCGAASVPRVLETSKPLP